MAPEGEMSHILKRKIDKSIKDVFNHVYNGKRIL